MEARILELFTELANKGLPLEPRPGSALAEGFAMGDLSAFSDVEMFQLLILMALYRRNRHAPGRVARQPQAAIAPRGSWPPGGGVNHSLRGASNYRVFILPRG